MFEQLDPTLTNELANPLQTGDFVELPFYAPYLWVLNGKANLKNPQDKFNVPFFGGFAVSRDDFELAVTEYGNPGNFVFYTMVNQEGKEYEIYASRAVAVAPIVTRERWIEGRGHVQVLAYAGMRGENGYFAPWGPVVLTAKSYTAKFLRDSLKEWESFTAKARREFAPSYPANLFYCFVGTFGERKQIMVGKGSQSPITPINLYKGNNGQCTQEMLQANFVGMDVVHLMKSLKEQAKEWVEDWKKPAKTEMASVPEFVEDDGFTARNAPLDEMPF